MPEGPEVESARVLVHNNLAGLRITQAIVADDEKVFVNCKDTLQSALEGRKLLEVKRKGKYLWFLLDGEGPIPLIHFGMTGSIIVQGVGSAKYTRINIDTENWPPRFCKLELVFEGGKRMAFVDGRRFGKVKLQSNPLAEEPVSKLGFDFISEMPSLEAFSEALARFQRPGSSMRIKALLLDQAFAAGVGNWVADEVLYQARIHPEQPVADMEAAQIKAMHTKMLDIGQISVAANADYTEFPPDWLFHFRWTGKQASSIDGRKIDFVTVGSRTSAYVPALQKLVKGSGLSSQKPASRKAAPKAPKASKGDSGQDAADKGGKTTPQQGSKRKTATAAAKVEDASPDAEEQEMETAAGELGQQQQQKPSGPQKGRGNKRKASPAAAKTEDTSLDAEQQDMETAAGEPEQQQQKPSGPQRGRGNKRKTTTAAAKTEDASLDAEQQDMETAAGELEQQQQKPSGAQKGRGNKRKAAVAVEAAAGEPEQQQKPSGPQKGRSNKRKVPDSAPEAPVNAAIGGTAADGDVATAEGNRADDAVGAGRGRGGKQVNKHARVSSAGASPAAPASAPKAAGKGGRSSGGAAAAKGAEKGNAGGDAKPEATGAKRGRQQGKTKAAPAAAAAAAAASAGASQKGARPKRGAAANQK